MSVRKAAVSISRRPYPSMVWIYLSACELNKQGRVGPLRDERAYLKEFQIILQLTNRSEIVRSQTVMPES